MHLIAPSNVLSQIFGNPDHLPPRMNYLQHVNLDTNLLNINFTDYSRTEDHRVDLN